MLFIRIQLIRKLAGVACLLRSFVIKEAVHGKVWRS